ncbi:hypothetical protein BDN72DRAFT_858209 [Pluteus cervinus]|uniref:Uncharacterized protein n=1 Tax=Pluteus cervinus TaxID=181527 RepID=A0ACD3AT02_9AGAR|nr:hypothetical protein BDN72DRAFT_858209 [Pluteus cervinus]
MTSPPSSKLNLDITQPTKPEAFSKSSRDPLSRETPRNKLAAHLVEQAIRSLSEIWRPQDIPTIFLTSAPSFQGQTTAKVGSQLSRLTKSFNTTHLPSPVTPTISPTTPVRAVTGSSHSAPKANPEGLTPIKPFVHEVLRRSRTSGYVLQTALCYLEAIRPKIPGLVHAPSTSSSAPRISHDVIQDLAEPCSQLENGLNTVRIRDEDDIDSSVANTASESLLSPSPDLPSPLLCPRRAFLASLILASKFTQDKCYSNRAWAKLCGLPPREISRCEHALGEALEWRLWVVPHPIHRLFVHKAKFAYDHHHHYQLLPFDVLTLLVQISSVISRHILACLIVNGQVKFVTKPQSIELNNFSVKLINAN